MPTILPFAYNSGSTLPNCSQIGNIAFLTGTTLPPQHPNTNRFWASPDFDTRYIIPVSVSAGTVDTPVGVNAFISFEGTEDKTESAFNNMVSNYLKLPSDKFNQSWEWKSKLTQNNLWTNYYSGITIFGISSASTESSTTLNLTTPVGSQANDLLVFFFTKQIEPQVITISQGLPNLRAFKRIIEDSTSFFFTKFLYSAETATYTFSTNSFPYSGFCYGFRGVDTNAFISTATTVFNKNEAPTVVFSSGQEGSRLLNYYFFQSVPLEIDPNLNQILNIGTSNNWIFTDNLIESPNDSTVFTAKTSLLQTVDLYSLLLPPIYSYPYTYEILSTSGTWTKPSGITQVIVECWGAGGAGGGSTSNNTAGGGGAGGMYAKGVLTYPSPSSGITYTIGAGGIGATGNGPTGGDTSWDGGVVLAKGGPGGGANGDGTTLNGGVAATTGGVGDIFYFGGDGTQGNYTPGGGFPALATGGNGGGGAGSGGNAYLNRSYWDFGGFGGEGGAVSGSGSAVGSPGKIYGSGGGGAARLSVPSRAGGNGAPGLIRVSYLPTQYTD